MIRASEYIDFVAREYLDDFIRAGGAAVKFAVPLDGAPPAALEVPLRDAATARGYVYARVDARSTRVHMIEKLFHDIARQIEWDALARVMALAALGDIGFVVPEAELADLDDIARRFDYAAAELRRDFNRQLQHDVMKDYAMAREFRMAMLRLCQAQVDSSPHAQASRATVIDWLTGELKRIAVLKDALIFQRITRSNARHMLFSLGRWIRRCGRPGLVLLCNISQLAVPRRNDAVDGVFYTMPAAMDAYEVLRQLIDGTDELESCFVLVIAAPEFLTDERRGVQRYHALKLRIWDEVRDRRRMNMLGALVRIGPNTAAGATCQ